MSPVHAAAAKSVHEQELKASPDGFWTPERIRRAEANPLDSMMARKVAGPAAAKPVPPVTKAKVVTAHGKAPAKMIGRLYAFQEGSDQYATCSATVIASGFKGKGKGNQSVVLTAAHCVYNPENGWNPDYIVFNPDTDKGSTPKGLWGGWRISYYNRWRTQADSTADYAFIVMAKHSSGPIQKATGGQSLGYSYKKRDWWAREFGYAAVHNPGDQAYADDGSRLRMCKGHTKQRKVGGQKFLALKCDLSHGASGGPIIVSQKANGYGKVISVVSFFLKKWDGYLYSPIFDRHTRDLFLKMRKYNPPTWNLEGVELPN
ncbi:hypothetical protein [Actinocorallia longicatena]|uniref:trypsin-like serine peptidase n=1 Tax=Actinocorallia longicatena TaxID=111803 RepID=UPI0031DA49D2